MLCGYQVERHGTMVPCGRCMACRVNHKRMWTGRILGEARYAATPSTFLTLTYEHEPEGGTLRKTHIKEYLKKIQHPLGKVRYFACGEYGDKTMRPHYHMILFNHPPEAFEKFLQAHWCNSEGKIRGFIKVDEVNQTTAAYVCGYVTKKMGAKDDPRLEGRLPEFAQASRKPPLGAATIRHMQSMLETKSGCKALADKGDIPMSFRMDGKIYPIGKYWRDWLRERMGITNPPRNPSWELDMDKWGKEQDNAKKTTTRIWRRQARKQSEKVRL